LVALNLGGKSKAELNNIDHLLISVYNNVFYTVDQYARQLSRRRCFVANGVTKWLSEKK